jgi:hypothetical protein
VLRGYAQPNSRPDHEDAADRHFLASASSCVTASNRAWAASTSALGLIHRAAGIVTRLLALFCAGHGLIEIRSSWMSLPACPSSVLSSSWRC